MKNWLIPNCYRQIAFLCFALFASMGRANNIQITNRPQLINRNEQKGTVEVYFRLNWDNSWKVNKPNNWDAAWVFVKFREGANNWRHTYIDKDASAHRAIANVSAVIKVGTSMVTHEDNSISEEGLGVFLYRRDNGSGTFTFDSVCLRWNYVAQNLDAESVISLRVFALEMVYIPEAPFYFGHYPSQGVPSTGSDIAIHPDSNIIFPVTAAAPSPFKAPGASSFSVFSASAVANVWYPFSPAPNHNGNNVKNADGFVCESSDWVNIYRNSTNSWSIAGGPLWQRPGANSSATTYLTEAKAAPQWHQIRIEMPSPYVATHFYSRFSAGTQPTGFFVEGSQDGQNWTTLTDNASITAFPAGTWTVNTDKELSNLQNIPYKWFRFNYFNKTTLYLSAFGPIDKMLNGSYNAQNAFYYDLNRPYDGKMPIKVMRSSMSFAGVLPVPEVPERVFNSSPDYPNGYKAFYIMKHELPQQAYADFLNCLDVNQQKQKAGAANPVSPVDTRFSTTDRCWIKVRQSASSGSALYGLMPNIPAGNPYAWDDIERNGGNIAMSSLGWTDVSSYLCWAGLRPLTEMEYEKACRGTAEPLHNEYAWGTQSAVFTTNTPPTNYNFAEEMPTPSNANFIMQHSGTNFPLRTGCLATEISTRADAGASFYGVLNLTDNVSEYYVNVTSLFGLNYDGAHGTGVLDGMGLAQMPSWPDNVAGMGVGIRGIFANNAAQSYVSNRNWKYTIHPFYNTSGNTRYVGCRGGRTAPN